MCSGMDTAVKACPIPVGQPKKGFGLDPYVVASQDTRITYNILVNDERHPPWGSFNLSNAPPPSACSAVTWPPCDSAN